MAIELKTYNEILGTIVRKMIADSPVNDINRGSVLLTLLEGVAANDFDNNAAILNVLETLNIDALSNVDLDNRAGDYGLSRFTATKATGFVTISDTSIVKRSTSLYVVKPPPIAGSTVIYVNNAYGWSPTGSIYIGRGTARFEGPISYTSIVNNGSFYTIYLASALQKDHLLSDLVVDSQGTANRMVPSGTLIKIPANNKNPEITYILLRDAVIPAGEDKVENVPIVAKTAGKISNTGINTIVEFSSLPFVGAAVTNTSALIDGRDTESDDELRERIKSYASTLARGTRAAILSSIVGVSDATDSKQIVSAVITEPVNIGDPSIIYIDDGTGFQPSYAGQPVDTLLASAVGGEEFLQLANFPLPRPQVVNLAEGPYELVDQSFLSVNVDGVEERVYFNADKFSNIAAATLNEVSSIINDNALTFRCRLTDDSKRFLLYPVDHKAESIQVLAYQDSDDFNLYANTQFKFPTNTFSHIKLYLNNKPLTERERSASISSKPFTEWSVAGSGNLIIAVDGTPEQDRLFSSLDFDNQPVTSASLEQWAEVFNKKFAGITATITSAGQINIRSNRSGSDSSLKITGGSYMAAMFDLDNLSTVGTESDFDLNRQTGSLQLKIKVKPGDSVSAGIADAKGSIESTASSTGVYNLSTDASMRPSEVVFCVDGETTPRTDVVADVGNMLTVSSVGSSIMRIMSNTTTLFYTAQIDDFVYIVNKGDTNGLGTGTWFDIADCGLFKIVAKGSHTSAGVDSYIDVRNHGIVVGGPYIVQDSNDIQVFSSENYPQLWSAMLLSNPASTTLSQLASSINNGLTNLKSSVFKTSSVKTTSSTEDGGSIATPVSVGRASLIIPGQTANQDGNPSHVANKISQKDLISGIRFSPVTTSNVWLNRVVRGELKGTLSSDVVPGKEGVDPYSEQLTSSVFGSAKVSDIVSIGSGSNRYHFRSIKEILPGNIAATQHEKPRTLIDYIAGETVQLIKPLSIASDDSIVFIIDKDDVGKTINVNMWRSGRVNNQYLPSNTAFSADDIDNEPGINFGNVQIWSKTTSGAEFKDYAVWFYSRNWYRSGGAASSGATMILRSKEFGLVGDRLRFRFEYPALPNQSSKFTHSVSPEHTLVTYYLASDAERVTGIIGGTTIKITSPSANVFTYEFQEGYVDLSQVLANDVFSLLDSSGISAANRGQFSILSVNIPNRQISVYNPNGSITPIGQPEISTVQTIADIAGSPARHTVQCTAQGATSSTVGSSEYFVLYDNVGKVVFWYDIDNAGAPAPTVSGATRYVKIPTVATGDSANTVASKTAAIINSDPKFTASAAGDTITVDNTFNGSVTAGYPGPDIGFTIVQTIPGTDISTLGGRYFSLADSSGSVAVWFNVNGELEPPHGKDRSIQVVLSPGDNASVVASKIAAELDADAAFHASVVSNTVTITDVENGERTNIAANTSGFTVSTSQEGVDDVVETIAASATVKIFPLTNNSVAEIVDSLKASSIIGATAVGDDSLLITKATRDEVYSWSGNSSALAYDHNPNPASGKNTYISMFDGLSFVKTFDNANPQFVLKSPLLLPGVVPAIYDMSTCPNVDGTTGEVFRLVPVTIPNIKHHLTHKALSQLPLITDIDIASAYRKIQVKSKLLGSQGAVEVVGGRANIAEFSLFGEAQSVTVGTDEYAELKISAHPYSINPGDMIKVYNSLPAKRLSRLSSSDSWDVENPSGVNFKYLINPKDIGSSHLTTWSISDVSASYSRPAGLVWRWEHNDAGSMVEIVSISNGTIASFPPTKKVSDGSNDALKLDVSAAVNGSATTKAIFRLGVSDIPDSGDHFLVDSVGGVTFGIWFDQTGSDPLPTNPIFVATTHKIRVDISGLSAPDDIVSELVITLSSDSNFTSLFTLSQIPGTSLVNVAVGDLLAVYGSGTFLTNWSMGNLAGEAGAGKISGLPVVGVNASMRYIDVVNPNGQAMSPTLMGTNGKISIFPAIGIRWNLKHSAKTKVDFLEWYTSGMQPITVQTKTPHFLRAGDSVVISGTNGIFDGTFTVSSTSSVKTFTFSASHPGPAGTLSSGTCIRADKEITHYSVEKIGFNGLTRLRRTYGDSPSFVQCGVAVDDVLFIGGTSFDSSNNGYFRIVALDDDSLVYENASAVDNMHDIGRFNDNDIVAQWTEGLTSVSGVAGTFQHVNIGDWIKKSTDDDKLFVQVVAFNNPSPELATIATLGQSYRGSTGLALGVRFNQTSGMFQGVELINSDDVQIFEGDSVRAGDSLVIENIVNSNWFNTSNSGVLNVAEFGSDNTTHRPYIMTSNAGGVVESRRLMSVKPDGVYLLESERDIFESIRMVDHTAISPFNINQRSVYFRPANRLYKISSIYGSKIRSMGKIGIEETVVTGIDGYLYYTGLLSTVQKIVDGYEPDPVTYPGRRAVGSIIELLPPLVKQISIAINATTKDGVNINDITNDIRSTIINYVNNLGVGQDVILSEIIARVMSISGVAAVTFTTPSPSEERIAIADDQKAQIIPDNISIS